MRYCDLPAANDAIKAVLLVSSGLVADGTLKRYASISSLLAGASDEATFTGYSRSTLANVVVTTDNTTNDWVTVDCDDPSWSPTSAQALGKIVFYYDPDTTSSSDSNNIPLFADDFVFTTPTSGTVTYQVATGGFAKDS